MLFTIKEKKIMKYDTTTTITDYDINWKKIKSACMTTISKEAGPGEPSENWKKNYYYVNIAQLEEVQFLGNGKQFLMQFQHIL